MDTSNLDIPALLEEIPRLVRVRALVKSLSAARYFSRLGEPLSARETDLVQRYLDGLGFPDAEPATLDSFDEAADAALALDLDPAGWEAEEMLRAGLVGEASEVADLDGLNTLLTFVAEHVAQLAKPAMEDAAAIADMPDDHVLNAAIGGAVQAAHGAALTLVAHEDLAEAHAHPFAVRHQLYVGGRWPLGLAGSTFNML